MPDRAESVLIKPISLNPGDAIGVFTPSSPGYKSNLGLFENGVKNLERLGFEVVLGSLAAGQGSQGYRSGTPQERAAEFMALINNEKIRALISTIGGSNSSSMIPFLDFDRIAKSRKIICGFSDVTSLHLAIHHYSKLVTFYGPSVMCWFGEWPDGVPESHKWFLQAVSEHRQGVRKVLTPSRWSNHQRNWQNGDWQTVPRVWNEDNKWSVLNEGQAEAPILTANLNTLVSAAGTPYFPNLDGRILLIEDMDAPMSRTEKHLRHLSFLGVFEKISALIVGKPEVPRPEGAPFTYEELISEVVGPRKYPIVTGFDCGHTLPMITIPQGAPVRLVAKTGAPASFEFLDGSIE